MLPNTDALYRHWKRTCWVLDMWGQANQNNMVLQPLSEFGWNINNDILTIDWDSKENMEAVQERVTGLLKGCKCKTWCRNKRCGYRGKGKMCSVGCECINCTNTTAMEKESDNSPWMRTCWMLMWTRVMT